MAHIVADRILETTVTTGTGAITLSAAVVGFRRFSAVCAVGDTVPYFIEAVDSLGAPSGDYEWGIGTYSGANTLTRTLVQGSSNGGAAVNFSAGSKNVGMAALASATRQPGEIQAFIGNVVPSGWLELDGSLKSRAQYPGLWSYAQTCGAIAASDAAWTNNEGLFSPGDGATTFRLPDHRGEFHRSWDHGRGIDSGRGIATKQTDQLQGHKHADLGLRSYTPDANDGVQAPGGAAVVGARLMTVGNPTTDGINGTPRTGTETRPRSIAVLTCVKT